MKASWILVNRTAEAPGLQFQASLLSKSQAESQALLLHEMAGVLFFRVSPLAFFFKKPAPQTRQFFESTKSVRVRLACEMSFPLGVGSSVEFRGLKQFL